LVAGSIHERSLRDGLMLVAANAVGVAGHAESTTMPMRSEALMPSSSVTVTVATKWPEL